MRKNLWLAARVAIFMLPAIGLCQQQDAQAQQAEQSSSSQAQSQTNSQATQTPPAQEDSLAAAARRAREQKKETTKPAKVFDNDNLPTKGGVSTVGTSPTESASGEAAEAGESKAASGGAPTAKGESYWREKFATLRHKLEQDQAALDVMQRELAQLDIQYYPDNPVQGMQQQLTRSDINDKTAKIDAMKKQIQADEQAISDAEDELHKAGGDSGWAR
jgi:hypothetical protein